MIGFSAGSRNKRDIFRQSIAYGIVSSTASIDTLTVSVMLANYFRSAKGYRTAVAVIRDNPSLKHMLVRAECVDVDPAGYDDGLMTYYITESPEDMLRLSDRGYERIIIDFGEYHAGDENVLMETDRIRALVSTHDWRYHSAREFLFSTIVREEKLRQRFGNMVFSVAGTETGNRRLEEEFDLGVKEAEALWTVGNPCRMKKRDLEKVKLLT